MHQDGSRKRFLIAPLDWGLGHVTRCIPIIRALRRRGHDVVVAAGETAQKLLSEEFGDITFVNISGYTMRYATHPLLLALKFPFMVARVYRRAKREHNELAALITKHAIDCIISDQRFGCHAKNVLSIYISHQLCVKMPKGFGLLEKAVAQRLRAAAEAYDELWIPDYPGDNNLTGDLTRKYPLPSRHRFIGPLSRFAAADPAGDASQQRDLLILLSGPEPQRTMLELKVLKQLSAFGGTATVCRGAPDSTARATMGKNIELFSHLPSDRIASLCAGASAIICRGGYSSIMDLVALGKTAVLVPTPGQTEQQYLCRRLALKGMFAVQKQSRLDIGNAAEQIQRLAQPALPDNSEGLLDEALDNVMRTLSK
jgi:uncharacterized protein (TIGR00661 family)